MHQWTWVSSPDGTLTGLGTSDVISGRLIQMLAIPVSGSMPTSGYDLKLVDSNGFDWLIGVGANLPSSCDHVNNLQSPFISLNQRPVVQNVTLTPVVSGAGDTKSAILRLWVGDIRKGAYV